MIEPDTLFLLLGCLLSFGVMFIGILIKEVQIHQERKLFDKSDVAYRDGDNT